MLLRRGYMTRKQFFEWLKTCPAKEEVFTSVITTSDQSGYRVLDDFGEVKVHFWFKEDEE